MTTMSDNRSTTSLPPFPPDYRASGVLLHVTSLPSPYGIGDLGPAALAMAPLQDLLNLGKEARMNVPGSPPGNWCWRCTDDMLSASAFRWLRDLTETSNRSSPHQSPSLSEVTR